MGTGRLICITISIDVNSQKLDGKLTESKFTSACRGETVLDISSELEFEMTRPIC